MFIYLSALLCVLIWYLFIKRDRHLEYYGNLLPGPRAWPLVGNSFTTPNDVKDTLNYRGRLIDQYGDVCRVWINNNLEVTLSDPKDVEILLKHRTEIKKAPEYDFFKEWLGTGLIRSPIPIWTQRRKALTPTFHATILNQFMNLFNEKTTELVTKLKKAELLRDIDLLSEVRNSFVNIVCETIMGIKPDKLSSFIDEYAKAIKQLTELITYRSTKFYLFDDFIWRLTGWKAKEREISRTVSRLVKKIIHEKELKQPYQNNGELSCKEGDDLGIKKKTAFLEMILKMKEEGDPAFKSNQDVIDETNTFFFGGHDTTTTATCFTLEMLARHPSIQEELYTELKTHFTDSNVITASDLQNLPFLDRVCKETLRLFPSVPLMSRQLINDLELPSGQILPKGCIVVVSIFHVQRHPKYYKNPDKFDPDNFLPEISSTRHPFAYIPFSAGPRNCIGQKFALLGFKMTVAKLALNFKISLPEGPEPPLNFYHNVVLVAGGNHKFVLNER